MENIREIFHYAGGLVIGAGVVAVIAGLVFLTISKKIKREIDGDVNTELKEKGLKAYKSAGSLGVIGLYLGVVFLIVGILQYLFTR